MKSSSSIALALICCSLASCRHTEIQGSSAGEDGEDSSFESYRAAYQSDDSAIYRRARDQHAAWLAEHPGHPSEREVRARYGKLLYALGEHERAAAELSRVAKEASDFLGRGAARNAIVVLLQARTEGSQPLYLLRDRGRLDRVTLDFRLQPIVLPDYTSGQVEQRALPAPERALAAACENYLAIADPQDDALPHFYLLAAELYFRHGQAIDGAARCAELITRWPQTEDAAACAVTSVAALDQRHAWKELEQHARAFRSNLSLIGADHQLEAQLEKTVQYAAFNRIRAAAESPDRREPAVERRALIKGAEEFRAFQREFPYSESADEALYNAFVYFERAEKRAEAVSAGQVLLAMYAQSPLSAEVRKLRFLRGGDDALGQAVQRSGKKERQ